MITEIGKIIDPIADKLLQLTLLVLLLYHYPLAVFVLILFLIKETSMTICGLLSIHKKCRLDGALWCGKVSTTVFYLCMVTLILLPTIQRSFANVLLLTTAAFLLYSFIIYMRTYHQMLKRSQTLIFIIHFIKRADTGTFLYRRGHVLLKIADDSKEKEQHLHDTDVALFIYSL